MRTINTNFILHLVGYNGSKREIGPCFEASTFNQLEVIQRSKFSCGKQSKPKGIFVKKE